MANKKLCSRNQASAAAETIGKNDDLLTEIFIFLPIKSLIKFKSVSKHWFSLISNPYLNFRLNQNPKPKPMISGIFVNHLTLLKEGCAYDFINLNDSESNPPPFRFLTNYNPSSSDENDILHSCNGLFLCRSISISSPYCNYYIYNHTTNHYTKLPQLGIAYLSILWINLAFDPSTSPHYKVISVSKDSNYCQIQIYSSKTRVWKISDCTFLNPLDFMRYWTRGVFCNGAIHWIIPNKNTCLYFNVDKEKVREIPTPLFVDYTRWYFGESRGHLHLIESYQFCSPVFDVYELKQDYSGWFVKYRVDLHSLATVFPEMWITILCLVREFQEDNSYLVLYVHNKKAIRYNFKDNTFQKIHDFSSGHLPFEPDDYLVDSNRVFQFTQSLASVSLDH